GSRGGGFSMHAFVRAGLAAALFALFPVLALAADKPFHRDDLADSAIRLEAQIKKDAGAVVKPAATLRREVDTAFQRSDYRLGVTLLGQIVATAPEDAASWLKLGRAIRQIWAPSDAERTALTERAATAAYIAYQRATARNEEADALVLLGATFADRKIWRPALDALRYSLDLREVAEVRANYERMRDEHGFRLLDYTVDADS